MNRFILTLFICLTVMLTPVHAAQDSEPDVVAQGAVLMDFETGRVLWGKNEKEPLAMASTTKIMTAIIALENSNLEDIVTVSKRAALAPEVHMELRAGEQIKLEDLLYALMLESFNDSAIAIAEHVEGSVESFCLKMTAKAKELGALDTVFETPNGLDKGDHHSTAYDMALITRYALANPMFLKIINTPAITVTSDKRSYSLTNKDRLIREYQGANGVKTGFTGKAGHCFVGAAKRGDMQLISVVLASGWGNKGKEQKWRDTKALLDYGFACFKYQNIITKGQTVENIAVERSRTESLTLYYEDGLILPLSEDELRLIRLEISAPDSVKAPVTKGEKIGSAKVFIGDTLWREIPLLAESSASRHDLKTSLEKVVSGWLQLGWKEEIRLTLPEF